MRWREGHTPGRLLLPLRGNSPSAPPLQHYSTTRNGLVVFVGEPLGLPPHPSGLTASHLPLKGKALKTRSSAFPFRGRCPRRGRMRYPVFRTRHVGPSTPGAVVESHQLQFPKNPGPSGPAGIQTLTQILRAGNVLPTPRGNPSNGGPGVRRI